MQNCLVGKTESKKPHGRLGRIILRRILKK